MKAVVFKGPNNFSVEEVEKPSCPKGGVLIKVMAVGLCGSDIRTFSSGHPKVTPPQIIGHEVAGIIDETDNDKYKIGDKVVITPAITCGKCYYCENGIENHCMNMNVVGTNMPGGYAQYMDVPAFAADYKFLHVLDKDADLTLMPLGETASSAYSTQEYVNVSKGETVVIIGAGPLGNLHSQIAKARGAKKVILSEANDLRLEKARRFSSTDVFVNPTKEDLKEIVLRETNNIGADVVITACPVGIVQEQATHYVRARGRVLLFGGLPQDNCHVSFDSNLIHYKEIAVMGGYAFSPDSFSKGLELIVSGKIDAGKFVTHTFNLDDIEKGIDAVKKGEAIKVVLTPWA